MQPYIDLNRRFLLRENYSPDELLTYKASGTALTWNQIERSRVAIIVAPANFGKTTELAESARRARADGKLAVFVALRKVLEFNSFENGLTPENAKTFSSWKSDTSQALTLFIDSLDEAALGLDYRLEKGLKLVTNAVGWPRLEVRLVISTRPAVLDEEVRSLIEDTLNVPIRRGDVVSNEPYLGEPPPLQSADQVQQGGAPAVETIDIFSMLPLTRKQATLYLGARCAVSEPLPLLSAAKQHGLGSLCEQPGGLAILANIDLIQHPPDCLTEVFEKVTEERSLRKDAQRIADAGHPSVAVRRDAIYKLAAASILCQRPNIELSLEEFGMEAGALSASVIAGSLLDAPALKYLLGSSRFIDVGQPQVKLFPDELVPYWAAKRLSGLVSSAEHAVRLLDCISWKSPTGEQGVYRQLLSLAGWLATLNTHCRVQLLARDPQAVAFFGDMRAPGFPLADAERALRDTFQRIAEKGDRLGRGYFVLTSENYWQAGGSRLRGVLRELFDKWGGNSEAREQLLDIGFCAKSDCFRDLVLQESGQNYAVVLSKQVDAEYLAELGVAEDLEGLAKALTTAPAPKERTVSALLPKLAWRYLTPDELAKLVAAQIAGASQGFHVSYALATHVADDAPEGGLFDFVEQLFQAIQEWGNARLESSAPSERLAEVIVSQLAILIERKNNSISNETAALFLKVEQYFIDKLAANVDCAPLQTALTTNSRVRQAAIKAILAEKSWEPEDLSFRFFGYGRFCPITLEDAVALGEPRLAEAIILYEKELAKQAARAEAEKKLQQERKQSRLSADRVASWNAQLQGLRSGTDFPLMTEISDWLADAGRATNLGAADFKLFEHYCGAELLAALTAGFGSVWRKTPLVALDQSAPWNRPIRVRIGLQGLRLELGDGGALPELTNLEVACAIQHGVLEFNQVPKWFVPLLNRYPEPALAELSRLVDAASEGLASRLVAEVVLCNLSRAPAHVRDGVAPHGLKFLCRHPLTQEAPLSGVLDLCSPDDSALTANKIWDTAREQVETWPISSDAGDVAKSEQAREQNKSLMTWAAYWLTLAPESFSSWFRRWTPARNSLKDEFLLQLAVFLKRRDFNLGKLVARTDASGVQALAWLHTKMLELVNPDEDRPRISGVIYTPNKRDHAERFRDSLISLIGASKSHFAYQELSNLARTASGNYFRYIQATMFLLQEERSRRAPLLQRDYQRFEDNLALPISDWMSFAFSVHNDLNSVKYSIEKGEFSLRRFFSSVAFERPASGKVGLALEEDFQAFLGNELNHFAANRYTVDLEPQLPEATRRDILCRKGNFRASVELKMSERWTLDQYMEALEMQLVGQYMRARDSKAGFFVVVLQRDREWEVAPAEKIRFPEVISRLEAKALSLEAANPGSYIRVVGIDAVPPLGLPR